MNLPLRRNGEAGNLLLITGLQCGSWNASEYIKIGDRTIGSQFNGTRILCHVNVEDLIVHRHNKRLIGSQELLWRRNAARREFADVFGANIARQQQTSSYLWSCQIHMLSSPIGFGG